MDRAPTYQRLSDAHTRGRRRSKRCNHWCRSSPGVRTPTGIPGMMPAPIPSARIDQVLQRNFLPFLTAAALLCMPQAANAGSLPKFAAVPGGVAVVKLGAAPAMPKARFAGNPVLVVGDEVQWLAIVGIPLEAA